MTKPRRLLSNSLAVLAAVLTVAFVLLVAAILAGDNLRSLWRRFVYESDLNGGQPPQEVFEQFRRDQEAIAHGADEGPLRCSLEPWGGGSEHPDLRLSLTNTPGAEVALLKACAPSEQSCACRIPNRPRGPLTRWRCSECFPTPR